MLAIVAFRIAVRIAVVASTWICGALWFESGRHCSTQITPALGFLSRPSLRAFVTWAHWSDTFRGQIAPATDPNAVRGIAVGVQMESWW